MNVRKADFSGSWYPADPFECEDEINRFLEGAVSVSTPADELTGGIVPHAGWYFSGSIACNVIRCLKDEVPVDTFIIYGMHLHPGSPSYLMKEGAWETPFGEILIEETLAEELSARFSFKIEKQGSFTRDNTIELQLPFVKYFYENTKIVPIGVPPSNDAIEIARAVADISKQLGLRVKVLGSTDLTHYGLNYGFDPKGSGKSAVDWVREKNDRRVINAMLSMDPQLVISEALMNQNACCAGAAASAIATAKEFGAKKAEEIVYSTSYEKSPGDSFVGYAGVVF
ncbi:MAG: AmmeMemoRadiSam system protein B [Deltaproteobacteria bacterium]|nr:AmmeMemoRadiSam system protein B [Deltaproteobacteria bacterium]